MMGQILTEEDYEMAERVQQKSSMSTVLPEDVFDWRAYKNIVSTNTIWSATDFLNADKSD